jgi:hypothetical protein
MTQANRLSRPHRREPCSRRRPRRPRRTPALSARRSQTVAEVGLKRLTDNLAGASAELTASWSSSWSCVSEIDTITPGERDFPSAPSPAVRHAVCRPRTPHLRCRRQQHRARHCRRQRRRPHAGPSGAVQIPGLRHRHDRGTAPSSRAAIVQHFPDTARQMVTIRAGWARWRAGRQARAWRSSPAVS